MTHVRRLIGGLALLAAGCATGPAPRPADMDIDFARGCWVQKDAPGGKVEAFLRLLPDGEQLVGRATDVSAGDWITSATFAFARSGETARFEARDMPDQPPLARIDPAALGARFDWARPQADGVLAAFAEPPPARTFLFVEGGRDRLAIRAVRAEPDATLVFRLFDGERDGCD